jgi:hypothetical protein
LNNPTRAQDEQGAGAEASAITVTAAFVDAPGGQAGQKNVTAFFAERRRSLEKVEAAGL